MAHLLVGSLFWYAWATGPNYSIVYGSCLPDNTRDNKLNPVGILHHNTAPEARLPDEGFIHTQIMMHELAQ